jgi:BirA family biotin operon repressor/biotin-[acetyl-CoA-carboxylase] ligase
VDQPNPLRLAQSAIDQGYRLFVHDEIGSTNDEAMALARAGDPGRAWLIAKTQTKGRGRRGRQWASPPGNLYASLLLVDEVPAFLAPQLGFVAGTALARALRECIGDDMRLRLKWPNDILFDSAKLAGILLESCQLGDGRFICIIGIGVNCVASPSNLPYRATALTETGALRFSAQDVFLHLSGMLAAALDVFARGVGFGAIRDEWLSFAAGLGGPVKVDTPSGSIAGIFRTIDETGRLVVESGDAHRTIEAGDVWLAEPAEGSVGCNRAAG